MEISTLHALVEALKTDVHISKVFISQDKKDHRIPLIKDLCRKKGIQVKLVPNQFIARKAGNKNQGIWTEISPVRFFQLEEIVKFAKSRFILMLNGIYDVGNIGALIRTAVAMEVDGIFISQKDSAPINETVLKSSAGALLHARIVMSKNISEDIRKLKKNHYWIVGTSSHEGEIYTRHDFRLPTVLVVGNEHKGLSPVVKKNLDFLVNIPHSSKIESLNVSVATAIVLFEALRQRNLVSP